MGRQNFGKFMYSELGILVSFILFKFFDILKTISSIQLLNYYLATFIHFFITIYY